MRLVGDGSKFVWAGLKLMRPPAGWPGVRRRSTERGASVRCLPAACGVQSLGGDEAPVTDGAEFSVFTEISPRASLRASSVNSAFLAELAEHELERLNRCAPPLVDRGSRRRSVGDGDGEEPPCCMSSRHPGPAARA